MNLPSGSFLVRAHSNAVLPMRIVLLVMILLLGHSRAEAQSYQRPPQAVLDVLSAPATPRASVGGTRDIVLLYSPVLYPSIAEVSQPFARLAGLRIDTATSGQHNLPRFNHLLLERIDGAEVPVKIPPDFLVSSPFWSPDGRKIAFTRGAGHSIELWVVDARTGDAHVISGVELNAVLPANGPCSWMPDSASLLCTTVPAGRSKLPEAPSVPPGPRIQESYGKAAPIPTFEDLLENQHDSLLFDYFATAQLALVNTKTGAVTPVGIPAIFEKAEPSPDGAHILVERIRRPYSFVVPEERFPRDAEVWDLHGQTVYTAARLPLQENIPIGGVATGPRDIRWHPKKPATLVWVEALDDGNPKNKVPSRDRILSIDAPFSGEPKELWKTEKRFAGIEFGEQGDFAVLRDFDRDTLHERTWFVHSDSPSTRILVWDLSRQDRYHDPGTPVVWPQASGHSAILMHGNYLFLHGEGASPDGARPFLDRLDLSTLESVRIFQGEPRTFEEVIAVLSADGTRILTRRESLADPPNYLVRAEPGGQSSAAAPGIMNAAALTHFGDPSPQLRAIQKQLVRYKRPDGVELSMTVYLPPDYKAGEKRPAAVWAYPLEFTDASVAGQVSGSPYRFTTILGASELFYLLDGYVVLDNAAMPVVGDPETVNNSYLEQITADAKSAIDKAAEMGFIDPHRVGVGGHSYGAFMTANLLAHSDLFRAGVARSGAYNRTLTPFGFQNERRTLWQAPDVYLKLSPFLAADKIKVPILLIHGEADNNSGTFPIQSDRMFRAIKGNGGIVRYVTLPSEAHGYSARESIEHTLWEMLSWFDKYVKNADSAPPSATTTGH